jgi:DNA topoisomerase-1
MRKNLVIVESPAKAKTIGKYLGKGYKVMASVGHVIDLPKSRLGVDIEHGYEPEYVTIKGKSKILKDLAKEAKTSDEVLLATDLDREGEAIAWHIANYLKENSAPKRGKAARNGVPEIHRIVFNEITKSAIQKAIAQKGDIDDRKVDAQQARRILDRLVGYLVSPQLWSIFYKGLSAGRVQTVALRLICERETEIEAFVAEEYWTLDALLRTPAGETFPAQVARKDDKKLKLGSAEEAAAALRELEGLPLTVTSVTRRTRHRAPQPPFITSTLQMDAARRLGFSSKKTMMVAQQLYEGVELGGEGPVGLITYMRTDSVRLSDDARRSLEQAVTQSWGARYLPAQPRIYKVSEKAQDAHEAIRPTDLARSPEQVAGFLTKDQLRLYEVIWGRTLASLMSNAESEATSVEIAAGPYMLRATGSVPTFDGWLAAYSDPGGAKETVLPPLQEGMALARESITPTQHFTQPPPRYRDSSLVKELESRGIGRPSTYASIISVVLERKYVERESGAFKPTLLGREVWRVLDAALPQVFEVTFTAAMEEELDKVELGQEPWQDVVDHFYGPLHRQLALLEDSKHDLRLTLQQPTDQTCPKCGRGLFIKWGSNGRFLACPGYPECRFTKGLPEDEIPYDEACPSCGHKLVVKTGRYGRFVACSSYPECRFTKPFSTGIVCPRCKEGQLVEKRSKRGRVFYGCSTYPKCDNALWNKPVPTACPTCQHPFMLEKFTKAKGAFLLCPQCAHEEVS